MHNLHTFIVKLVTWLNFSIKHPSICSRLIFLHETFNHFSSDYPNYGDIFFSNNVLSIYSLAGFIHSTYVYRGHFSFQIFILSTLFSNGWSQVCSCLENMLLQSLLNSLRLRSIQLLGKYILVGILNKSSKQLKWLLSQYLRD